MSGRIAVRHAHINRGTIVVKHTWQQRKHCCQACQPMNHCCQACLSNDETLLSSMHVKIGTIVAKHVHQGCMVGLLSSIHINRGRIVVKHVCQQKNLCCQAFRSKEEALLSRMYVNRGSIVASRHVNWNHYCQACKSKDEPLL